MYTVAAATFTYIPPALEYLIHIIVGGMAVWRASSIITREWPFLWLRSRVGIIHDSEGNVIGRNDTFFARLFSCVWCISPWLGGLLVVFQIFFPFITYVISAIAALSTMAILLDRCCTGPHLDTN